MGSQDLAPRVLLIVSPWSHVLSLSWLTTAWICPLEPVEGHGGWKKAVSYNQRNGSYKGLVPRIPIGPAGYPGWGLSWTTSGFKLWRQHCVPLVKLPSFPFFEDTSVSLSPSPSHALDWVPHWPGHSVCSHSPSWLDQVVTIQTDFRFSHFAFVIWPPRQSL